MDKYQSILGKEKQKTYRDLQGVQRDIRFLKLQIDSKNGGVLETIVYYPNQSIPIIFITQYIGKSP